MPDESSPHIQRHAPSVPLEPEALLADDPELALAWADMAAWHEAHPCTCEAGCDCEEGSGV